MFTAGANVSQDPEGRMSTARPEAWSILRTVQVGTLVVVALACHHQRLPEMSTTGVLREAQLLYDYGPERPPVSVNDPDFKGPVVADGRIPRMWISTAVLKKGVPVPRSRILARIRSERAYAPMGIAAGYNYIWRNSRDTSLAKRWVTQVVPVDSKVRRHDLRRDERLREYTHGDPAEPRLVILHVHSEALATCLEDLLCRPTGHCGYY
jgi:hypothetical protein